MSSIKLSPNHGVNPTICTCMWCGKPKNEVALLGRLKGDVKAPMYSTIDYEPCEECASIWQQGVALIEVVAHSKDGRPVFTKGPNGEDLYPTGRITVVTAEAAQRWFSIDPLYLQAGKKLVLDTEAYAWVDKIVHSVQGDA